MQLAKLMAIAGLFVYGLSCGRNLFSLGERFVTSAENVLAKIAELKTLAVNVLTALQAKAETFSAADQDAVDAAFADAKSAIAAFDPSAPAPPAPPAS